MNKDWVDVVKEKLDSYNERKQEIDETLKSLLNELSKPPYNIGNNEGLMDEQNLIWKVKIGKQIFTITEEEIAKEQIIEDADECGNIVDTGERLSVKQALQNLILEKLK